MQATLGPRDSGLVAVSTASGTALKINRRHPGTWSYLRPRSLPRYRDLVQLLVPPSPPFLRQAALDVCDTLYHLFEMDTNYLLTQVTSIIGQLHTIFDEIGVPRNERDARETEVGNPTLNVRCPH